MIRELIGLYPMNAFLACGPSGKHTPLVCVLSSPEQMKSPFGVSPFPVQRTSEITMVLYLKRFISFHFISFLSSSNFPAIHNVCTFHFPTVRLFLTGFSLCVFFSSQFFDSALVTRQMTRTLFTRATSGSVWIRMMLVYGWFLSSFCFTGGGICIPSPNTPPLSGLVTGMEIAGL